MVAQYTDLKVEYSSPPFMRPPLENRQSGHIRGVAISGALDP